MKNRGLTPVAGTEQSGYNGDGIATQTLLNGPVGLVTAAAGHFYFSDSGNQLIREVDFSDSPPTVKTVAGKAGLRGTAVPTATVTDATFAEPGLLAWRASGTKGELFVSDQQNQVVRKINLDEGIVTVSAGGGPKFDDEEIPGIEGHFRDPGGVAEGPDGTIYLSQKKANRVVALDKTSGRLQLIAGSGQRGKTEGIATEAKLDNPEGIAVDVTGTYLYVADKSNQRVVRIKLTGGAPEEKTLSTIYEEPGLSPADVATDGNAVYIADDRNPGRILKWIENQPTQIVVSNLSRAQGIAVDDSNNIYVSEVAAHQISKIDAQGNKTSLYKEDGSHPMGISVAPDGSKVYVALSRRNKVVELVSTQIITRACIEIGGCGFSGDGGPAIEAPLRFPTDVFITASGAIYISDSGNGRIRQVEPNGRISTVMGAGAINDGGRALEGRLRAPEGVTFFANGQVTYTYISDTLNHRIRRVDQNGTISTVAGNGVAGFGGDAGPATEARLNNPEGITVDREGNLYIADAWNHLIRKVDTNGMITTFPAGSLSFPSDVSIGPNGELFIADKGNHRIRKVDPGGIVSTFAGTGNYSFGYLTDQHLARPATSVPLTEPEGVLAAPDGRVFISDTYNDRVVVIEHGILRTIWRTGPLDYSNPEGLALDAHGNLYVAASSFQNIEGTGHHVYRLKPSGTALWTAEAIVGNGRCGIISDGMAKGASLCAPSALSIDEKGDLLIADTVNGLVRRVKGITAGRIALPPPPPTPPPADFAVSGTISGTTPGSFLAPCHLLNGTAQGVTQFTVELPEWAPGRGLTVQSSTQLADFDAYVYQKDGTSCTLVQRFEQPGDEQGVLHASATHVVVTLWPLTYRPATASFTLIVSRN